jgi:hypothetical protein
VPSDGLKLPRNLEIWGHQKNDRHHIYSLLTARKKVLLPFVFLFFLKRRKFTRENGRIFLSESASIPGTRAQGASNFSLTTALRTKLFSLIMLIAPISEGSEWRGTAIFC